MEGKLKITFSVHHWQYQVTRMWRERHFVGSEGCIYSILSITTGQNYERKWDRLDEEVYSSVSGCKGWVLTSVPASELAACQIHSLLALWALYYRFLELYMEASFTILVRRNDEVLCNLYFGCSLLNYYYYNQKETLSHKGLYS